MCAVTGTWALPPARWPAQTDGQIRLGQILCGGSTPVPVRHVRSVANGEAQHAHEAPRYPHLHSIRRSLPLPTVLGLAHHMAPLLCSSSLQRTSLSPSMSYIMSRSVVAAVQRAGCSGWLGAFSQTAAAAPGVAAHAHPWRPLVAGRRALSLAFGMPDSGRLAIDSSSLPCCCRTAMQRRQAAVGGHLRLSC